MADNVKYTEPDSGTSFATQDIAGVHHQQIITEGQLADGTAQQVAKQMDEVADSTSLGVPFLAYRRDNPVDGTPVSDEDDWTPVIADERGRLHVSEEHAASVTKVDSAAFTEEANSVGMIGAYYTTTPAALSSGDAGAPRISQNRNLYTQIRDGGNSERGVAVTAGNALTVDGSAVTQPVSAASLPLPSGASTAAKQPALGTAGSASADVISIQGIASMTAVKVDGSGVTQPVSGTVTVQQSTASNLKVDLSGTAANATAVKVDGSAVTQPVSGTVTANAGTGTFAVSGTITASNTAGDLAHDDADSTTKPVKIGGRAIAHGSNPTAVAADDRTNLYANRHGILFIIGGHPNVITRRDNFSTTQTDVALVTVSSGTKIVVTSIQVTADNAMTATPAITIGFGTANTPTGAGVVASHPGLPGGGGFGRGDGSGILGIGADNEDLRVTAGAATGGSITVVTTYFTIES